MLKKILLDNKEFQFTTAALPMLIHGEEHVGASLFTMSVVASLYTQGAKVIALTGYPMAREEFINQTGTEEDAHFFTKEKKDEFIEYLTNSPDISEYVILLKNIEFYDKEVFSYIKNFKNLILSGDVNRCSFKEEILQYPFSSKIYFSQLTEQLPELQKYEALLVSENNRGVLSLEYKSTKIYPSPF